MQFRGDIPTPALLLDLDAFEDNIRKMATHVRSRNKGFRPHGKTHKCPQIARALIAAGAVGVCAARLSEAAVFAEHGLRGLLVTTAVIGKAKIDRAIALARTAPDTMFVVDDETNVRQINDANAGGPPVALLIDLYFGRTGIAPGEPALRLARVIDSLPNVELAGLQAYDGQAAHTTPFSARGARTNANMAKAAETRKMIEEFDIPCSIVTGGSTGTYRFDSENPALTELQPGSFIFMDLDYRRIGGPDGADYADFKNALTVITTVVSTPPGFAIVDGGYKAFSTDRPFTPQPVDLPGVEYGWAGDEHGRLDLSRAARPVKLGDRVEFIPPHCDPTVNLYDQLYGVRGDRVEVVWPIAARGKSQ